MVHIHIASCRHVSLDTIVRQYGSQLTPGIIDNALSYRMEDDAKRFLLGRILLLRGMIKTGAPAPSLASLAYTKYKKPFMPGGYHFNISHSGEYVMCAISNEPLGIDIEEIKPVDLADFSHCFTIAERRSMLASADPLPAFYRLWTLKEAVIKADGRGMHIPLADVQVDGNKVHTDTGLWYVSEIPSAPGYITHLATSRPLEKNYSLYQL